MLGIYEKNCDDGESYLLDNYIVVESADLNDPWGLETILFEGTKDECLEWVERKC